MFFSRNYNEFGSLRSGKKYQMNNKENMNDKAISLDCEWEVYCNSTGEITGTSKACTIQIAYLNSFNKLMCILFHFF